MLNLLAALKVDLGLVTNGYDERLNEYIESAKTEIARQGATLDLTDQDDAMLVVQYASWMWRKRDTGEGMPRMVRYALNNRIFAEKMQEAEG